MKVHLDSGSHLLSAVTPKTDDVHVPTPSPKASAILTRYCDSLQPAQLLAADHGKMGCGLCATPEAGRNANPLLPAGGSRSACKEERHCDRDTLDSDLTFKEEIIRKCVIDRRVSGEPTK